MWRTFFIQCNGFYCFQSWLIVLMDIIMNFIIIKNIDHKIIETYEYKLNDENPKENEVKSNLNGFF
jgi:hypothetical protein